MKALQVRDQAGTHWMCPETATVSIGSTVELAVKKMLALHIHHLIVMEQEIYRGILDARDLFGVWDRNQLVDNVMRSDIPLVDEAMELDSLVDLIIRLGATGIALRRNQKVNGIVTTTDLFRILQAELKHHKDGHSTWATKGKDLLSNPMLQSVSSLILKHWHLLR